MRLAKKAAPPLDVVAAAIRGVARAGESLASPLETLLPVPYDISRRFIDLLAFVTGGKRILLILDAWEQGANLDTDVGTMRKFLDNVHEWPSAFHIVVVTQDRESRTDAYVKATALAAGAACREFRLPPRC